MTAPVDRLVELLETLPSTERQEITAWLLNRTVPTAPSRLRHSDLRGSLTGVATLPAEATHSALGGSLPVGEDSQLVTFRLPAERHAELRAWCSEHGFTMAAVVRGLIERFLEDQQRR